MRIIENFTNKTHFTYERRSDYSETTVIFHVLQKNNTIISCGYFFNIGNDGLKLYGGVDKSHNFDLDHNNKLCIKGVDMFDV